MRLLAYLKKFKLRNSYRRIIEVSISRANILHNLQEFKKTYPTMEIAPVIKSNAYGHGLVLIAKIFETESIPFLIVDSLFEAIKLRHANIETKILINGFTPAENIIACRLKKIAFTITSLEQLTQLHSIAHKPITLHLKIDTGMHRQGILPNEVPAAISLITSNPHLCLEGILSHFASAHMDDPGFTHKQIAVWETVVLQFKKDLPHIRYFHIANSAGAFFTNKITCNLIRIGIGLLGSNTSPFTKMDLRPALRLETLISGIKKINIGDSVGYSNTFIAAKPMTIATIPVGYFEGVDGRLADRGVVSVNGHFCPIIGKVSMNITSIDISEIASTVKLEDRVTVISDNKNDPNSHDAISKLINEIPYVILSRIPEHLYRRIV